MGRFNKILTSTVTSTAASTTTFHETTSFLQMISQGTPLFSSQDNFRKPKNGKTPSYNSPCSGTIGEYLFHSSQSLVKECYETRFIQGIKSGNLCPVTFTNLNFQDAIYCLSGCHDYHRVIYLINLELLSQSQNSKNLRNKIKDLPRENYLKKLRTLFELKSISSKNYKFTLFTSWNLLPSPQRVEGLPTLPAPCSAVEDYICWKRSVIETLDPIYALIVMLPCERLWAYLGDRLLHDQSGQPHDRHLSQQQQQQQSNRYQFWMESNSSSSSAEKTELFLEAHRERIDLELAKEVYHRSMQSEVNFFLSATGQHTPRLYGTEPRAPAPAEVITNRQFLTS
jgi:thiaminase (transcriptional activator TenA)